MSARLALFRPDAPEPLRLAARAQHIRRWEVERDRFPRTRKGYIHWRTTAARHHAEVASRILREVGYDEATVARVSDLLEKKRLKSDPDAQVLEDVACLVFLEHYLDGFAAGQDDAKLVQILAKTWDKMSAAGRAAAGELPLSTKASALIGRALGTGGDPV
jgi:hypothetical protein